jgi:hypothetical protein
MNTKIPIFSIIPEAPFLSGDKHERQEEFIFYRFSQQSG